MSTILVLNDYELRLIKKALSKINQYDTSLSEDEILDLRKLLKDVNNMLNNVGTSNRKGNEL